MCVGLRLAYVATPRQAKDEPGLGGFRKRIPLELSQDDLARLHAHQAEHGSMRATLLAGLVALDAAAEAQASATAAHAAQEAAEAHVIRLEAELDASRAATAEREAKGSRAARTAGARANDQMMALQDEAAQLRQELTDAKATLDATYQTLLELDETR